MNFTPTDEQWAKMKKHIKSDKYKKEDFFVFETRAVGDRVVPHRYTRLMPDFLQIMEEDAKKGVSLMLNHNWSQFGVQSIPIGKVFDARIGEGTQEGENMALYTTQYIHKDDSKIDGYSKNDIINLIETGVLADTSVGFSTDSKTTICSICGNPIYSWDCKHFPGRKYIVNEETNEVKQCIAEIHKPSEENISSEGNNVLIENSVVFDGAYPNAVIQSRLSNTDKEETLKVLEGKQELSEKDIIIGYTSKNGVNLLYKHSEEKGGVEMAKFNKDDENEEVATEETSVDNVDETVEQPEEVVEETTEETTEEVTKQEDAVEETTEEESTEENTNSETESEEENLYSEAEVLEKFDNIADNIESLVQLAKEGLENRNEVIKEALDSGVHSMGNSFNKEIFTKTFSNMTTKDIKEMGKVWEEQANAQFSSKKISKVEYKKESKTDNEIEIKDYSRFKTGNY